MNEFFFKESSDLYVLRPQRQPTVSSKIPGS